jgi:hypothetical protein
MAIVEKPTSKPEHMTDLEYAAHLLVTGAKDPDFASRIRAESERISQEVYQKYGLLDIAVPSIRALRDGDEE